MSMNSIDRAAIAFGGFVWAGNWLRLFRSPISIVILAAVASVFAQAAWAGLASVTKSFSPSSIAAGGTSTLTITINHSAPGNSDNIAFIDTYPAGLNNAATPNVNNTCGGTVTAVAGGSSLSLSGVKLAGNNSCTVSVSVTSAVAGSYLNSTGIVTSDSGPIGPATATLTVVGPPPATVVPGGFNAFETSTASGNVAGVIKTKIAASNFNLAIVALKTGGTAIETAFASDVKLEIVDASAGGGCGAYALIRNLGTLTFTAPDSGRKNQININEPNAWPNARIRMTYPATGAPTIVACSTDNFAIRPANFLATASDTNSTSAGATRALANTAVNGGNVHKAGQPFQISGTSRNTLGATTSNYAGTPTPTVVACVLPGSGCVLGTLAAGTWSSASGVVTTTNASYSEVGTFSMKLVDSTFAAVDSADGSTAIEKNIESAVFNVGRFVPDHFDLLPVSIPVFKTFNDTACSTRSFTYVGQPVQYVTVPQASITAKNRMGGTTLNYTGSLWKLVGTAGFFPVYSDPVGTPDGVLGTPAVTDTGSGTGLLAVDAAETFFFTRTTPVMPFMADISLTLSIGDMAEDAVAGNGTIDTLTPAIFTSIAFDSGNLIRFGRLVLSNAHGSEVLSLPVPAETQFWNGTGFIRNSADFCTQLAAANVGLSNWRRNLNACETSVSLSGRFNAGRGNLKLSAPGANNTGSVDLALNLGAVGSGSTCVSGAVSAVTGANQTWLQGKGSGVAYDQNPVARGSFGLYRGNKPLIYIREMY